MYGIFSSTPVHKLGKSPSAKDPTLLEARATGKTINYQHHQRTQSQAQQKLTL